MPKRILRNLGQKNKIKAQVDVPIAIEHALGKSSTAGPQIEYSGLES